MHPPCLCLADAKSKDGKKDGDGGGGGGAHALSAEGAGGRRGDFRSIFKSRFSAMQKLNAAIVTLLPLIDFNTPGRGSTSTARSVTSLSWGLDLARRCRRPIYTRFGLVLDSAVSANARF